jgi:hypothetical protein
MNKELSGIKHLWIRLLTGFTYGFIILFPGCLYLLERNGWSQVADNPYLGPPPLYTSLVLGFIGGVVGALLGLFRWKKSRN